MEFYQLLLLQLIAHVLADFIFQSDKWSRHKRRYGFRSRILYWHVLIVFSFSFILSFNLCFFLFALISSSVHLLLDGFKVKLSDIKVCKKHPLRKAMFFLDQSIHVVIICLTVFAFNRMIDYNPLLNIPVTNSQLIVILGFLLCLKPSNIFIREIFSIYNIKIESNKTEDLLNAGKLIGNIERMLTLAFLLAGQYEAIGFLLAGKSILRYEGKKTSKTEYVLIGTLLSFGVAIAIGLIILKLAGIINVAT